LGYKIFSRDDYKTSTTYNKELTEALESKENIVLANTHPDLASRVQWVARAQKLGYKHIRCLIIGTSIQLAFHLNNVRMLYTGNEKLGPIPYFKFRKMWLAPSKDEGFDKIEMLRWRIDPKLFKDERWKKAFFTYSEGIKG